MDQVTAEGVTPCPCPPSSIPLTTMKVGVQSVLTALREQRVISPDDLVGLVRARTGTDVYNLRRAITALLDRGLAKLNADLEIEYVGR